MPYSTPFVIILPILFAASPAPAQELSAIQLQQIETLTRQLTSGITAKERIAAARKLEDFGEAARSASRALCVAVGNPNQAVRRAASQALTAVNPQIAPHVNALMVDEEPARHLDAVRALIQLGPDAQPAVPVIVHHLNGNLLGVNNILKAQRGLENASLERAVRQVMARYNRKVSDSTYGLLVAVNLLLDARDQNVQEGLTNRLQVAAYLVLLDVHALGKIGGTDAAALNTLATVARSTTANVFSTQAVMALSQLGSDQPTLRKKALPTLRACTRHPSSDVRQASVVAIGQFGADARDCEKLLRTLSTADSSTEVRAAAQQALDQLKAD